MFSLELGDENFFNFLNNKIKKYSISEFTKIFNLGSLVYDHVKRTNKDVTDLCEEDLSACFNIEREAFKESIEKKDEEIKNMNLMAEKLREEKNEELYKLQKELSDFKLESSQREYEKQVEIENNFKTQVETLREENKGLLEKRNNDLEKNREEVKRISKERKDEYEESMRIMREGYEKENSRLKEENERFKSKYEALEVNSVLKGAPYENLLEEEMNEYSDKNGNVWKVENLTGKAGKGDFCVTNNYSNSRIMVEAKNMPKVSSTVANQQPKFFNNLNDPTNNYDGGIIVASGIIERQKSYKIEKISGKYVCFIEKYSLNNPERIFQILESMEERISNSNKQNKDVFLRDRIFKIMEKDYIKLREQKKNTDKCAKEQDKLVEEKKKEIYELFNLDIDEYLSNDKKTTRNVNNSIEEKVKTFAEELKNENKEITKKDLIEKVNIEFTEYIKEYEKDKKSGISKNKIKNILKTCVN